MSAKKSPKRRSGSSGTPSAAALNLADGYTSPGTKPKLLPWSFAERRLRSARNYWVCTTRPDRRPHTAPVWGIWARGGFWFSTGPSSRKARNLKSNPYVVIHLESGDEVVVLEGRATIVELTKELDRDYHRKYGMHLVGFPAPMVIVHVQPGAVTAWREKAFPASATRFRMDRLPP
jgi:general stress protein 26